MIHVAILALVLAQAASPPPAPPASEAPTAPASSSSGPTLDPALVAEVRRVAERVATLRATPFAKEPLALRAAAPVLDAAAQARAAALLPAVRAGARGRAWEDLGLGDAATPAHVVALLAADLPEVGLDVDGKRLLVSAGTLPDTDFVADSKDDTRSTVFLATGVRPDEPLVAHGLIHLLQRQRPSSAAPRPETTDAALAAAAWAEGEANFVAIRFLFQSMGVGDTVFEHNVDPTRVLDGRLVGSAIEALPAVERSLLLFVHQEGFAQVVAAYRAGSWRGVEQAAASRTSTRDVLHPDRAGAAPRLDLGSSAAPLAGLAAADEDRIGEQGIVALVSSRTGKDDLALVAADGWIGDRLVRWEPDGGADPKQGVTVWDSAWAGEDDAKEFVYAVGRVIEDGLAGTPLTDAGENRKGWKYGDRTARVGRQGNRVTVRIAPAALDARLESPPSETKKPSAPPGARR